MEADIISHIIRIRSIAEIGLLYSKDEYNIDRYSELQKISHELMTLVTGEKIETVKNFFQTTTDYPTAKVDIRGLLLSEDKKILLVQEADNNWSLPGGWADIGYSPSEVIVKEFKEETGLDVTPRQVLAIFDKRKHKHPPQPAYVYKIVFLCTASSSTLAKGFDIQGVDYFSIHDLPPLSEDRILYSQLMMLYNLASKDQQTIYFD
jgi:ADP-ribose pyrophosphatase YjhB (NUDIX family)